MDKIYFYVYLNSSEFRLGIPRHVLFSKTGILQSKRKYTSYNYASRNYEECCLPEITLRHINCFAITPEKLSLILYLNINYISFGVLYSFQCSKLVFLFIYLYVRFSFSSSCSGTLWSWFTKQTLFILFYRLSDRLSLALHNTHV